MKAYVIILFCLLLLIVGVISSSAYIGNIGNGAGGLGTSDMYFISSVPTSDYYIDTTLWGKDAVFRTN